MRWRKVEGAGHVEDRRRLGRGARAGGAVGGLGILGILALLLFGGGGGGGDSLSDIFTQLGGAQQAPASEQALEQGPDPQADLVEFMRFVMTDTQETWDELFTQAGRTYEFTTLVIFDDATSSGCGGATAAVGPHYCSLDRTVYLDLDFFETLQNQFGASGDFAQAYVISHEVAHHVQNLLGTMPQVQNLSSERPELRNELSVRQELQADCYAGVWGRTVFEDLQPGDIEEGITAAESVGDDRIQQQAQGYINPEAWTHGSSQQRVDWFQRGLNSGDPNECDTFSGEI